MRSPSEYPPIRRYSFSCSIYVHLWNSIWLHRCLASWESGHWALSFCLRLLQDQDFAESGGKARRNMSRKNEFPTADVPKLLRSFIDIHGPCSSCLLVDDWWIGGERVPIPVRPLEPFGGSHWPSMLMWSWTKIETPNRWKSNDTECIKERRGFKNHKHKHGIKTIQGM